LAVSLLVFGPELGHDFSSWLVQSEALLLGSSPYGEFFDIKPPGLVVATSAWIWAFGVSDASFLALQTLLTSAIFFGVAQIARKLSSKGWRWLAIFALTITITGSFTGMPLSPELFALPFLTWGTAVLMCSEDGSGINRAALLFSIAGTFKEPFVLIFAAVWLVALGSRRVKPLVTSLLIFLAVQASAFIPLILVDGLSDYLSVLEAKSQIFELSGQALGLSVLRLGYTTFLYLGALAPFVLAYFGYKAIGDSELAKSIRRSKSIKISSSLLVLISLGLILQQKPLVGHYALLIQFAIWILALSLWSLPQSESIRRAAIMLILVPGLLSPSVALDTVNILTQRISKGELFFTLGPVERVSRDLSELSSPDSCLHVAFGWKAGAYYHYSKLRPCSKHFLANLTQSSTSAKESLVASLEKEKPNVVLLIEKSGADMNTSEYTIEVPPIISLQAGCRLESPKVFVFFSSCPTFPARAAELTPAK
jgi:hypothetical protein